FPIHPLTQQIQRLFDFGCNVFDFRAHSFRPA
ncbi:MAG: hypothetical protein ACJAXU_002405, partial [Paracoccaceae bacterium]